MTKQEMEDLVVPPYPEDLAPSQMDDLISEYTSKIEKLDQEIIASHLRGDHEVGDSLRPKVRVMRHHLERFVHQRGVFQRG